MGFDDIFEIYTFVWGWHQFNVIWDTMVYSGLAFLPFFGVILNNFLSSVQSQDPGNASFTTLKAIEIDVIMMFIVILIAAQPVVLIEEKELAYVPACLHEQNNLPNAIQIGVDTVKFSLESLGLKSGKAQPKLSGYTNMTLTGFTSNLRIPVWWYGVFSFTSGFVYTAKQQIPCVTDLRNKIFAMNTEIFNTRTDLQNSITAFARECLFPAIRKYDQLRKIAYQDWPDSAKRNLKEYAVVDDYGGGVIFNGDKAKNNPNVTWMGSLFLLNTPGFYQSLEMSKEYSLWRNGIRMQTKSNLCSTVWISNILEEVMADDRVVDKATKELESQQSLYRWARNSVRLYGFAGFSSQEKFNAELYAQKLAAVRNTLNGRIKFQIERDEHGDAQGWVVKFKNFVTDSFATIGKASQVVKEAPTLYVKRNSMPIIASVMLMSIYTFLPLALVLSGYQFKFLIMGALGIFTVKFYFYLWHLVTWLDNNLLKAIQLPGGLFQISDTYLTIKLVINSLYDVLPIIWTLVIAWAGFKGMDSLTDSAQSGMRPASEAAGRAVSGRDGVVNAAAKAAGKKLWEKGNQKVNFRRSASQSAQQNKNVFTNPNRS